MTSFVFQAPTLFEATATAQSHLDWVFHDDPETSEWLAKHKKLAFWLKAAMDKKGLDASNPEMDEGGWTLTVPSADGFVLCIVFGDGGGEKGFVLLVTPIGNAEKEYVHTSAIIEAILSEAAEVSKLKVDRDA